MRYGNKDLTIQFWFIFIKSGKKDTYAFQIRNWFNIDDKDILLVMDDLFALFR